MQDLYNDIIIVGAGPTGLMLANQLARFGIDHLILDKKSGPTEESRALIVQARSMEIYEQLGLSDQVTADGQAGIGLQFYINGKYTSDATIVNPDEKSSPFSKLYIYEQSKNETLLYQHLLKQQRGVEWNTNILEIQKEKETYRIKAQKDGRDITCHCKYLIACDGSKSMVRDFSQVPFTGGTYLNVFYVADTHIKAGLSPSKLSLFLTAHGLTMLFPMKGENHFRVLGILPKEYYHQDEIPFDEIIKKAKSAMKMPVEFYDTGWHSTYRLHHKKVERFSKENIFFAGDAAHVHSPAGGQGMNTGLQDAYNLAWKLALVKNQKADSALLETYSEERNPIAETLLKSTDRLFSVGIKNNFLVGLLRVYIVPFIVPFILKSKTVQKNIFSLISQINIAYKSSSLSKGKAGKIVAGMRLPYFYITQQNQAISIYTMVNQSKTPFTIVFYNLAATDFMGFDKDLFSVIDLEKNNTNDQTLKEARFSARFVIVIRPDNYIAYINENANANEIAVFLKQFYCLK
jgi:2-polyprenyl-6-methoxyphenol hydroxylase-like FAD-dependent oxidoreductase